MKNEQLSVNGKKRPREIDLCRKRIAKLLDNPAVSFQKTQHRSVLDFQLSGRFQLPAEATGRQYTVLPLLQPDSIPFWVAVVLRYSFERGVLNLSTASIVIFRGLATESKTPLLRAEWDKLPPPRPHAQPHWHVYSSTHSTGEATPNMEIVHLAMAARWHAAGNDKEPHYTEPTGDMIVSWIDGCLSYLQSELLLLLKKRPI